MANFILDGFKEEFRKRRGLHAENDGKLFSAFVNYSILAKEAVLPDSLDGIDTDGGQDTGIDAVAVVINGRIILEKEEVDYLKSAGPMNVDFILIQSKSSKSFKLGDIGNFLFGVKNFFAKKPQAKMGANLQKVKILKDYLFEPENAFSLRDLPALKLYYVSTGEWTNDPTLMSRINAEVSEIEATGLFRSVRFFPVDASRLMEYYRSVRHHIEKEFIFDRYITLPPINNTDTVFLGIAQAKEFLKIISDSNGEIIKTLFTSNVRDYMGMNSVNSEIAQTISDPDKAPSFVLLNNGVTIVAKKVERRSNICKLIDFQIVNGCQTSHVLHEKKHQIGDSSYLPVKIIVTEDAELAGQVVMATNRQTEIKLEAFESTRPFHKTLEEFYNSFGDDPIKRLYYERRSMQYENSDVKPYSIITLSAQTNAFIAMFLGGPQNTCRYYGELIENFRDQLFLDSHHPYPYYISGLALNRVDKLIRDGELPEGIKKYKYHLLFLMRLGFEPNTPPLSGKKAEDLCGRMASSLWDAQTSKTIFKKLSEDLLLKLQEFGGEKQQAFRLRAFTDVLAPGNKKRPRGKVVRWKDLPGIGYGFIEDPEGGQDLYVHGSKIRDQAHPYLRLGELVEFDIVQTERGPNAINVTVVPLGGYLKK